MSKKLLPLWVSTMFFMSIFSLAEEKVRVYITDSQAWEMRGGFVATGAGAVGYTSGGSRGQTVEVIKTFNKKCPQVLVTMRPDKADFVILFDHEGGKGWVRKDNKIAVFNSEGDSIYSESTRSLGNAVKDACKAIQDFLPELEEPDS